MKLIPRIAVVLSAFIAVAFLSRCGGGSPSPQQSTLAPLVITTASLSNGTAGTPYSQTVQANGGVAPFTWSVSAGVLPHNVLIGTGTTNVATISGTPDTVAQAVAFTIKVMDSASHSATQAYTVSILSEPDNLSISPASLTFSPRLVRSTSTAQTETLTNSGSSVLTISSITIDGTNAGDFNQTGSCGSSLAGGASCTTNVTFTPTQIGARSAAIAINDDALGSPQSVSLTGVGVNSGANATLSDSSIFFGTQLVDTTSPAFPLVLNNLGTATLNIASIKTTANFSETDNCVPSVLKGATCTINLTFTPSTSGDFSGTLTISDNAPDTPQTVTVSGTGSTNTPLLNGYCFETCHPRVYSPDACPVGQPAKTPSRIPTYPCGYLYGSVAVDASRACRASESFTRDGRCEIN